MITHLQLEANFLTYILDDSQKKVKLQLELAAVVDAGAPFVRATYRLEGDGALVLSSYEEIFPS